MAYSLIYPGDEVKNDGTYVIYERIKLYYLAVDLLLCIPLFWVLFVKILGEYTLERG